MARYRLNHAGGLNIVSLELPKLELFPHHSSESDHLVSSQASFD
jgi:hypothetical protein